MLQCMQTSDFSYNTFGNAAGCNGHQPGKAVSCRHAIASLPEQSVSVNDFLGKKTEDIVCRGFGSGRVAHHLCSSAFFNLTQKYMPGKRGAMTIVNGHDDRKGSV